MRHCVCIQTFLNAGAAGLFCTQVAATLWICTAAEVSIDAPIPLKKLSNDKEAALILTGMTQHPDNFMATCAFGIIANIAHDPVRMRMLCQDAAPGS